MPILQNRSRGDSVKTEYDESQGIALAKSDEEAVETSLHRSFADGSETISGYFCESVWRTVSQKPEGLKRAVGQTARFRNAGARGQGGTLFPLAELRGGSLLSGCRGEASGAGRGQGPAQLSDGNRHLVLGITCRHGDRFRCFYEAGEKQVLPKMKKGA